MLGKKHCCRWRKIVWLLAIKNILTVFGKLVEKMKILAQSIFLTMAIRAWLIGDLEGCDLLFH